jgi:hypothetical protein
MTVRAYLCILIPLASGFLCHWRYRQISRRGVGPISIYHRQLVYRAAAWFCYGAATANAILFLTWAVT